MKTLVFAISLFSLFGCGVGVDQDSELSNSNQPRDCRDLVSAAAGEDDYKIIAVCNEVLNRTDSIGTEYTAASVCLYEGVASFNPHNYEGYLAIEGVAKDRYNTSYNLYANSSYGDTRPNASAEKNDDFYRIKKEAIVSNFIDDAIRRIVTFDLDSQTLTIERKVKDAWTSNPNPFRRYKTSTKAYFKCTDH